MDVSIWLRDLGLANYAPAFRANNIDAEVLSRLTAEDLVALGVMSVGHRRKLLDAIALLHVGRALATAEPPATGAPRAAEAERRQLTVLFCDLVGSTELAARLDPEDLREVMQAYQAACTGVIDRFEGHIARFLGDGVLAFFGWPKAHEDDAERAVRAGLQLVETIARLEPYAEVRLQARIGIATGQAVVGDLIGEGAPREEVVVGDPPNLAARLQAVAEPGCVVISQATRRLIGGLFELDDLGRQRLKGFAELLPAWRVSGESSAEGRFEARHRAGLTPLVGREEEISLLLRRWAQAKDGEGQVVLLLGEPGIGKSRLVREVRARLEDEPHIRLLYQCSPHHTTSPLHPVIEQLERAAGFQRGDPPDVRLAKLEGLLARATGRLEEAVPLIAALLGIATGERYAVPEMIPQRQKQLTLEVLVDQLGGLAAEQPVLLAYEDVHWIDPTTQELLGLAIERIQHLAVLAIVTFRPEFTLPWTGLPQVNSLPLTRLSRRDGAAIVDRVTGQKTLPAEVTAQIVGKADGVPLFVEELTKAVLESGLLQDVGGRYELSGPLPPLAIPATLHDSLLARLDRLAPVKEVAQIGAAIGREFSYELIAMVADLTTDRLRLALDQLVAAELVFRRGSPPKATYIFKHALVQDAAYGTLLKSRRQQWHARIAGALKNRFREVVESNPELLAHHLTAAGLIESAVEAWLLAGRKALESSANVEAMARLRKGLALIGKLGSPETRLAQEIELQSALGRAAIAAKGYAAAETGQAFNRARELCRQQGDQARVFPVLYGQYLFYLVRARLTRAGQIAQEFLELAENQSAIGPKVVAHRSVGHVRFWEGEISSARRHMERTLALYDPIKHRPLARDYAYDPRVAALSYLSWISLLTGDVSAARSFNEQAAFEAAELAHPVTLALALNHECIFLQLEGGVRAVLERSESLLKLSEEQGFRYWLATATHYRGWALAAAGDPARGAALMSHGINDYRATGSELGLPYRQALLAQAYGRIGRGNDAVGLLDDAIQRADETGERWFEAELYRLKGELSHTVLTANQVGADSCFERAIEIARSQEAKWWELRAATSLARLWRDQGKRVEARDLLAPVYDWFTEGFDTADLKDAKALLDELS